MLLFCGFGLMSKGHLMTLVVIFVGACAAASAVLMVLDLSRPYSGIFRASSAPLEQVLAVMGKEYSLVPCDLWQFGCSTRG